MNILVLNSIVDDASSNTEGMKLYSILEKYLSKKETVVLSVNNETPLSSSFLNSSLGALIDNFGFDLFKNHVKFKGTKSQFDRVSKYIRKYSEIYSTQVTKQPQKIKTWNKSKFAKEIVQRPSVITRWLSGTHNFTIDTLTDIEILLGIKLLN